MRTPSSKEFDAMADGLRNLSKQIEKRSGHSTLESRTMIDIAWRLRGFRYVYGT